jgi:GT2 family glycosyltransferase
MRSAAFAAAGGFDGRLIAGEEPELCFRLRRAGWTVWRLDREMTRHDAAMTHAAQWWRRAIRGGWAYAEGAAMHGASPEAYNRRQRRSIMVWGAGGTVAFLAGLGAALAGFPAGALLAAAVLGAAALMALRIARDRRRRFADPWPDALAYGAFTMLGKLPQALGVWRYHRQRRQGGPASLIEYKT